MPSSTPSRWPAKTLSAIGFNRWSVIVNSLISIPSKASNAPNRCRRAPRQQEQHTNIAVHGEKRSVQLAQVIGFNKRMFVSQQGCNNRDPRPRGPRQPETKRQPPEKRDHADVHPSRNQQRPGNAKFLRHGKKSRASVVLNILAGVEHVEATDPQRDRRAKNQHARVKPAGDGDPRRSRRDAQRKSKKEMRPVGEALREGIEKENRDRQRRQLQSQRI